MTRRLVILSVIAMLSACTAAPPCIPEAALIRHAHRVEVVGDTVYVLGGFGGARDGRDVTACDRGCGVEYACADLPAPLLAASSVVIDETLFAIVAGTVARYDAPNDRWLPVTRPDALPNSHFSAAVLDGAIVVVGGFPFRDPVIVRIDPATGEVTPMIAPPDVVAGDHFLFVATIGGELHLAGGIRESDLSSRHWIWRGNAWHPGAPLPHAAFTKFAAYGVIDDCLYVFAGRALAHRYESDRDVWVPVAPAPAVPALAASVVINDELHVLGGIADDGTRRGFAARYDPAADAWSDGQGPRWAGPARPGTASRR